MASSLAQTASRAPPSSSHRSSRNGRLSAPPPQTREGRKTIAATLKFSFTPPVADTDSDAKILVFATSQRSAGVSRPSPRSYKLIGVWFEADNGNTDIDVLNPPGAAGRGRGYLAIFGALHAGRKIFFKFQYTADQTSVDLPIGFMSPPVEASVIVS